METKIITLNVQTPQLEESQRWVKVLWTICTLTWVIALSMTCLCIGYNVGAHAETTQVSASEPRLQQMVGKLEIHSATRLSILETVEISREEQVAGQAWDVPLTDEEMTAVLETCEAGHISPAIGLGLIQVESSFRADAINPKSGCYGYCQLNPQYFPSGLSPVDNIRTGIEYLAYQLERYDGDLEAALTAYNAGYDTGDRTYAEQVIAAAATFRG